MTDPPPRIVITVKSDDRCLFEPSQPPGGGVRTNITLYRKPYNKLMKMKRSLRQTLDMKSICSGGEILRDFCFLFAFASSSLEWYKLNMI